MPKRNQTRRRNKRGGFWGLDDVSMGASRVGSDVSSGFSSVGAFFSNLNPWKKTDPYGQQVQEQPYGEQKQPFTGMGGRRKGKRGGAPAAPYNPAEIWLNQSKYPQSVGGKRTRRRGRKTRRHRK
jgi:hypothetical protein